MVPEYIILSTLVAVLSIIQSMFGIGLLVFGTPALLLMGYDFITTLAILVPASMTISLLQIINIKFKRPPISFHLYLISIPSIALGLYLAESVFIEPYTKIFIGFMLLLSAAIKLKLLKIQYFGFYINKYTGIYHLIMGLVHGLTNLGGAFLAILAANNNSNKHTIRYIIAHYYFVFTFIQLILILFIINNNLIIIQNSYNMVIAGAIYMALGNRIFVNTSFRTYDILFGVFMAFYGFIILVSY